MKPWAQGCTNGDYCQNQSMQTVNIGVFSKDDIGVIPAQNTYHSNVGSQVNTDISSPPFLKLILFYMTGTLSMYGQLDISTFTGIKIIQ